MRRNFFIKLKTLSFNKAFKKNPAVNTKLQPNKAPPDKIIIECGRRDEPINEPIGGHNSRALSPSFNFLMDLADEKGAQTNTFNLHKLIFDRAKLFTSF